MFINHRWKTSNFVWMQHNYVYCYHFKWAMERSVRGLFRPSTKRRHTKMHEDLWSRKTSYGFGRMAGGVPHTPPQSLHLLNGGVGKWILIDWRPKTGRRNDDRPGRRDKQIAGRTWIVTRKVKVSPLLGLSPIVGELLWKTKHWQNERHCDCEFC